MLSSATRMPRTLLSRRHRFFVRLVNKGPLATTRTTAPAAAAAGVAAVVSTYCRWMSSSNLGERLRVAIVGGGAAGLSSALHLAPLVEAGLIASPIDVYDAATCAPEHLPETIPENTLQFPNNKTGREIGVGIWSTALDPFRESNRESHAVVYQELTTHGTWVGDVGYRIAPAGQWLMRSHLPVNQQEAVKMGMPALLFIREKDMLMALQKAVHWEEQRGMIRVHRDGNKARVTGLCEESSQPWSTQLLLNCNNISNRNSGDEKKDTTFNMSERDYHLILAADGTHSLIRREYGCHESVTGGSALSSPIELPSSSSRSSLRDPSVSKWDLAQRLDGGGLQDRKYTVFRGNSQLTREQVGADGFSFQTWGVGRSMRFATVPMLYPGAMGKREERHVWFITIDDDQISSQPDPVKRRDMILKEFQDWHDPICRIIEATPPEEILMERAIAHRHCMGPILNFNKLIKQKTGVRPPNSGEGPCVVFTGDAYMTVDPILAQGFTIAMEGGPVLRRSLERSCRQNPKYPKLAFDPYALRKELKNRHDTRMDRLVCLLRATELVQALGQPAGGTMSGLFNTKIFRPLVRLIPNFIKAPIFDSVLKYSLGLPLFSSSPKTPAEAEVDSKATPAN